MHRFSHDCNRGFEWEERCGGLQTSDSTDKWSGRLNVVALSNENRAVYMLDDDLSMLKATSRLLDSVGWRVETFSDPLAFLRQASMHWPDVAIIDILMPDMNGLEVQTRLRRISPSTRVIVLTARDDPSVRRTAMNAGASAFFIKGVESSELLAGVKAAADSIN
jgi:FixJ family two-component response regulator